MALPDEPVREIRPLGRPPRARVALPGSKSLTNRALVTAALAEGRTTLINALVSDDTLAMVDALRRLGVAIEVETAAQTIHVDGCGGAFPARGATLDAGGAGTVARFLTAVVALGAGRFVVDGNARMRQRPVQDLVDALCTLGVRAVATHGCPPVVVDAAGLAGGRAVVRGATSSQFLSGLLLAAPYARADVELVVDGPLVGAPYVEMTVAVMAAFGVQVEREGLHRFHVRAGQRYRARLYAIEPDASSAAYFFAAAALTGGRVEVPGLSAASLQGDVRFIDLLEAMGCRATRAADALAVEGPPLLRAVDVDLAAMSDQTMTLAALAPFADGPTRIRGVAHIRHQESDRLAATAAELRRLGQEVDEFADGLRVTPRPVRPATVVTYDDHRIAMAFALIGLRVPGVRIAGWPCVRKTFPDFFERLELLRTPA